MEILRSYVCVKKATWSQKILKESGCCRMKRSAFAREFHGNVFWTPLRRVPVRFRKLTGLWDQEAVSAKVSAVVLGL
jgi:hypothetical protein